MGDEDRLRMAKSGGLRLYYKPVKAQNYVKARYYRGLLLKDKKKQKTNLNGTIGTT